MFPFIAVLTILGFAAGYLVGRRYTEREVKAIERAAKARNDDIIDN